MAKERKIYYDTEKNKEIIRRSKEDVLIAEIFDDNIKNKYVDYLKKDVTDLTTLLSRADLVIEILAKTNKELVSRLEKAQTSNSDSDENPDLIA